MLKKPRRRRRGRSPMPAMRWPSSPLTAPKIPPSPLASPAPIARFVDDEPNSIKTLSVGRRIGKTIGKAVRWEQRRHSLGRERRHKASVFLEAESHSAAEIEHSSTSIE